MLEFLPQSLSDALSHLNRAYLYEIRLRLGKPITVNYGGVYRYLSAYGITDTVERALIGEREDIEDCIFRAGKYSVYSIEEQIKRGFITAENGERIGVAGEYVFERGEPLTIRNYTSLCIRVPHEIQDCAKEIYERCMSGRVQETNLLICSPAGLGKTTILRDLCRILAKKTRKNLLVCDERGEISNGNIGESCDVLKFADKSTAFEAGIRAMRPEIIVTDELTVGDCIPLKKAINAGVTVVASAHFSDFRKIDEQFINIFDIFVILKGDEIGAIKGVYNKDGNTI